MAVPRVSLRRRKNRPVLRTLDQTADERHASWLELFFDLVFVVAVSRLAHLLTEHSDAGGFLKYAVLFLPIWYLWVGFTFYADRFETEETAYRILMFTGMLAVTGLSLSLGGAFSPAGDPAFVSCYVFVRLVLVTLYSRAAYYVPLARPYCLQFIGGLTVSSVMILLSLLVDAPARYVIWAVSLAFELAIPFINRKATRQIPIDRSHIPERLGLFTIIVIGEAVVATATGVSTVAWTAGAVLTASLGFAVAAAIWWINFEFVEDNAIKSKDLVPRFVYLYGHFVIVASIVAAGVGVEHAISESGEAHLHISTLALIAGGVSGYLTAITIVRMVTGVCNLVVVRIASIAGAIALLYLGQFLPPVAVVGTFLLIMIGGIVVEDHYSDERVKPEAEPHISPCEHADLMTVFKSRSEDGCEECRKNNYKWVHLRLCLSCGHVGCCDTSIHKHATKHYHETGHPVMASLEAGENWAWCYIDERFVPLPKHVK